MTGWLTLIVGLVWIAIAGGLFSLQLWAWWFTVIFVGISIVEAFFGSLNGWHIGATFVAMLIPLLILAWLNSVKVKDAFGVED